MHYIQRVGRWAIILWQVRGKTWSDQWVLIQSALAAPFLALQDPMKWQDPILLADAEVYVIGVGRFMLRARSDDLWHVLPWREHGVFRALQKILRHGDAFVDAGANIGIYTVLASKLVGDDGCIISIEMMPDTADRLESHVGMNQLRNVTIVRRALSSVEGKTTTAAVKAGKYGQATIGDTSDTDQFMTKVNVLSATLDSVLHDVSAIRLVKMDLEGVELDALVGARKMLERTAYLIYERRGVARSGSSPVDDLMVYAGFDLKKIDGNNWLASR